MTDQPPSLRDQIAEALMSWAERNASPQYASLRRPETVRQNAYGRADAVLAVLDAARQTTEQPTCACGHPKDRHLTCCTECPCIWYAPTWPPTASGQQPETTPCVCDTEPEACTAVGQPAEAQAADEVCPPHEQWRIQVYDADKWNSLTGPMASIESAAARRSSIDMPTRLVRETTTWTVEDETR